MGERKRGHVGPRSHPAQKAQTKTPPLLARFSPPANLKNPTHMQPTISLRRDPIGRFANQNILARFGLWLIKLPIRLVYWLILRLYWLLSFVLPSRRIAGRLLWYQFIVLGWLLAAFFFHQTYNLRCAYNGQTHGWFVSKQECGDQAQTTFDSQELARQAMDAQIRANNPDLYQ